MNDTATKMDLLRRVVEQDNWVVLDTETTGLDHEAEICQIAIVDPAGSTLLDTLVRPSKPIPSEAVAVHGITNEAVAQSPHWEIVRSQVADVIRRQNVITYNAAYDYRMIEQSDYFLQSGVSWDRPAIAWNELASWYCAMLAYAEFYGDWNNYYKSYRWQRLTDACQQQQLVIQDAHSALGDALMTLALVREICSE